MLEEPLAFYASQGPISAPGRYAELLADLPRDIRALCRVVQGVLLHVFWAQRYGVPADQVRGDEVQLRLVARQLERMVALDPQPLAVQRPPAQRLVGNCRDHSVLLAALLRQQGVPARARCGFGRYFRADHYEDHWVAECWNADARRWLLVDAQLDALQSGALRIGFDPCDVPRDQFVVGGRAWQLYRSGAADADAFGIFDMHGAWFIRGNLVRDVAALNKVELLPWDTWGLAATSEESLTASDLAALDEMAALTAGDVPAFERVRTLYLADARWRVPATITSWVDGQAQSVHVPGV
ncbi:MAG: transglutaminase domain-containing protein [Chloroflexi bacterium]|nr:transglutaminase domain-containing protein [Chloroflexota bacterium]